MSKIASQAKNSAYHDALVKMAGWDLSNLAEAKLKLKHADARCKLAREAALEGPYMGADGRITDNENAAQAEEDLVSELSSRVEELEERSEKTMAAALKNVPDCRRVRYSLIALVSSDRKVSTTVADLIESANNLSKQLALMSSSIASAARSAAKQAGSVAASAAEVEAEAKAKAATEEERKLLQTQREAAYIAIDNTLANENPNYTLMYTTAEFLVVGSPVAEAAVKAAKTAEKATKTAEKATKTASEKKAAKKKASKRKALAAAAPEKISEDDIETESEPEEEKTEVDNKPAKRVCNWTDHDD